jgi:polyisoprenoid-binding protein YceI
MSEGIPPGTWRVQPERSRVGFRVKHVGFSSADGSFESFDGEIDAGPGGVAARGGVEVASIRTGDSQRDSLLASPLFFDAGQHPRIEFSSAGVEELGGGRLRIEGELTIAGRSNPLSLDARVLEQGEGELRLSASGEISRRAYALRFRGPMSAGNRAVGDRVSIELDLRAAPAG